MAKNDINTALPEEINGRTVVTHDDFLDAKIDDAVGAKIRLMTVNKIELGCSIADKKVREGGIKNQETGERWGDSCSVDLVFEGGKFGVRVDRMTYDLLETNGTRYLAKGTLETKANAHGFSEPNVKISSFERLF